MNAVMSTSENPAVTQSRSSMAQALDMSGSMAAAWNTLTMHPRMPFGLTDPGRRNWEVPKAARAALNEKRAAPRNTSRAGTHALGRGVAPNNSGECNTG